MPARLSSMKTVGSQNRSELERNATQAWQRGVTLDAMLRAALPVHPRGVWRLTHAQMNQLDLACQLEQARKVNRLCK